MHSSGSLLLTVVERIRYYVDEAISDAKYTNDYIIRHVVMPELVNVYSRVSRNFDNPIMLRYAITLDTGTEYYVLPPNVGEVVRIARMDDTLRVTDDARPRGVFNPRGPNWSLEGNVVSFRPLPAQEPTDWEVWYIPSGDFMPHYAGGGTLVDDADGDTSILTLGTVGLLGQRDLRVNAYAGGMLRVLNTTEDVWEERIVESYDAGATEEQVVMRVPLTETGAQAGVTYEIVPWGMQSFMQAVAVSGAMNLAAAKSVSQKQYQFLMLEYRKAIKTIGDHLANMQARTFKEYKKDTVDNLDAVAFVLR